MSLPRTEISVPTQSAASNEHYDADGAIIYRRACALDCEGTVSREPIEDRKRRIARLLRRPHDGIALEVFLSDHFGPFAVPAWTLLPAIEAATKSQTYAFMDLETFNTLVKRLGSPYRAGRSPHWLKIKNPAAPAAKREAEEDW